MTGSRGCYHPQVAESAVSTAAKAPRHTALVRLTHWLTVLCFFALLLTGIEILISHPRFYWGEAGNVLTTPLFVLPIPASRATVPSGYGFVMPDQNGWSRYLHFQTAWAVALTGLLYVVSGLFTGHFRKHLIPAGTELSWSTISGIGRKHLRFLPPDPTEAPSYNALQRLTYLAVIFGLFPLVIWTGLAMSPAFTSAFPFAVTVFGGQQSARTLHFFITLLLVVFFCVHIAMIWISGFRRRMRGMITGRSAQELATQESEQ